MSHTILWTVGSIALFAIIAAIANTRRVHSVLSNVTAKTQLPKAVAVIVLVAQASELTRVVSHVSIEHLLASIMLFTIIVAAKAGIDGKTHE